MTSGSSVMVVWEGTRPLLVEIQALVDHSMMVNPRRVAVGLEQNRLAILLVRLAPSRWSANGRSGCVCERGRRREGDRNQCRFGVTAGDGFQPA